MSDIEIDLFANPDARGIDPRYAPTVEVSEGPPMLASVERMCAVFTDVVMRQAPPADEIERYRTDGFHIDAKGQRHVGHRMFIERNTLPIEGYIGKQLENQWAVTVFMIMDQSRLGTFAHALKHEQANGDFVPIQVQARLAPNDHRIVTRNGTKPSRLMLPESEDKMTWLNEEPIVDTVAVAVETFEYAIVWCDRKNAPHMPPRGADGKPIGGQEVNVQVQHAPADPALAAALTRLAQATEQRNAEPEMVAARREVDTIAPDIVDTMGKQTAAIMGLAESVKALAERPQVAAEPAPTPAGPTLTPGIDPDRRKPGPGGR